MKPIPILLSLTFAVSCLGQTGWMEREEVTRRVRARSAYDSARGVVVACGGLVYTPSRNVFQTVEWDGGRWVMRHPAQSPPPRANHAVTYDAARREVVLFSGTGNTNDTWVYDGHDWTQRTPASNPPTLRHHAMAYDPVRERVVLFGGNSGNGGLSNQTWEWDGNNWSLRTPPSSPGPRSEMRMAWDPVRAAVLMFGGTDFGGNLNDTWEWNGSAWTQLQPANNPPVNSGNFMALDEARQRIVLIQNGSPFAGTWEWNGVDWRQVVTTAAPTWATGVSMSYDGRRAQVLVAFGIDDLADTWHFDGSDWALTDIRPRQSGGATAFDSGRDRLVMHDWNLHTPITTWEWDGVRWRAANPSNDIPRRLLRAALTFDGVRDQVMLFGGNYAQQYRDDQYHWSGSDWLVTTPAVRPSPRDSAAMTFDSARDRVVLFGGSTTTTFLQDTWEWDGASWQQLAPAIAPNGYAGGTKAKMAFDEARGRAVLVLKPLGALSDTWEWDGTTWVATTPAQAPEFVQALYFDDVAQRVVAVAYDNTLIERTWQWDGTNWTPATAPTPLGGYFACGYDRGRQRAVLANNEGQVFVLGGAVAASAQNFGSGCAGTNGVPAWNTRGLPYLGDEAFELELVSAKEGALAAALFAGAANTTTLGGCDLHVPLGSPALLFFTSAAGVAELPLPIPTGTWLLGVTFASQAVILDPGGTAFGQFAATNGVLFTIGG